MIAKSHITVLMCPYCYHSMYHENSRAILNNEIKVGFVFNCEDCNGTSRLLNMDDSLVVTIESYDGIAALKGMKVIKPVWKPASVTRVVDGDTFDAIAEFRFRILGINAPEMKTGEPGKASKKWLTQKILGQQIKVKTADHDVFGRLLAETMIENVDVGREMLLNGLAVPYERKS